VGEKYGLSADTLRYYERIGLIPPVTRTRGGIRNYTPEDEGWVGFVKCMRGAGISIDALIEYVGLFQEGEHTREARRKILLDQRAALETRIAAMQKALDRLNYKIANYDTSLRAAETAMGRASGRGCAEEHV
jgi:DNA-binding transcriptional MerR regulator